jgi:hypothetical protein
LPLWIRKRSGGSREEGGEAKEKQEKLLSTESTPSDLGCTIEDRTAEINWSKDFNFIIAKISVTTEITEFREIRPKFR